MALKRHKNSIKMEITNEVKQRIAGAIASDRENYPSDNRHATALGIAASVYNAIKKGNYDRQVSDANWVGIARRLGVQLRMEMPWTTRDLVYLRVHQQTAGGVPGQRPECHSVRHAEHRQDLHGKGLRESSTGTPCTWTALR